MIAKAAAIASTDSAGSLIERWRREADVLRKRGAVPQAEALASCASELEQALREHALEQLTVAQAVIESGYSASQIRRRFPGQRTIRRGDLPRKASGRTGGPELAAALFAEGTAGRRQR